MEISIVEGGSITSVPGFRAAGVPCGLKATEDRDLALVYCHVPCRATGVFTTNQVKAAPVRYDQELLARNQEAIQAVVINSGYANACTGEQGMQDARQTAALVGEELGLETEAVLVMSTGVIGQPLPMETMAAGIKKAAVLVQEEQTAEGGHQAALAIMTTDTHPKEVAVRTLVGGTPVTVAGMAKGAGMIHPDMATMLCLMTTDALVSLEVLREVFRQAVEVSFNAITVDGDTSTNDTVMLLANGLAGNVEITANDLDDGSAPYEAFSQAVGYVATELAQAIVRDGEGATKFVEITVRGTRSASEARQIAKTIAHSPLVKTALYGEDANWGRVMAAVGYSGVKIDVERLALWFGDLQLVRGGQPFDVDEERAAQILSQKDIAITVELGLGHGEARVWTCDLSHEYVTVNAHYRT